MISEGAPRAIRRRMPRSLPSRRQRAEGGLEPPPRGLVGWKSKPVVPWRRGKAADQNPGAGEMVQQVYAVTGFEQAEQIGAAKQFQTRAAEDAVEQPSIRRKARPRGGDPCRVAQRPRRDLASRSGHRPVAEQPVPGRCIRLSDDNETHAQSRKTEELAERAPHQDT